MTRVPDLAEVAEDLQRIEGHLHRMEDKLDMRFVPRELYEVRHKALRDEVALELASLRSHTESARRLAMWALGVMCTVLMGALIGFLSTGGAGT